VEARRGGCHAFFTRLAFELGDGIGRGTSVWLFKSEPWVTMAMANTRTAAALITLHVAGVHHPGTHQEDWKHGTGKDKTDDEYRECKSDEIDNLGEI